MAGGPRVFRRVPVGGIVAAVRAAALLAGPQVHPLGADLHALVALTVLRLFDGLDGIEVDAALIRHSVLSPTIRLLFVHISDAKIRELRSPSIHVQPELALAEAFARLLFLGHTLRAERRHLPR